MQVWTARLVPTQIPSYVQLPVTATAHLEQTKSDKVGHLII